ncbi:hypothetical protein [Labrys neptuniae]
MKRTLKGVVAFGVVLAHLNQVAFAQMVPDIAVPASQPGGLNSGNTTIGPAGAAMKGDA